MTEAVSLKPDLGRFGVWLPTRSITPELAAKIEALGFGTVWIGGSPDADLAWVDPVLAHTISLQLATGIVNIWSAPAPAVAESFHRIENAHPGRFLLGIGVGHREHTEEYIKPDVYKRQRTEWLDGVLARDNHGFILTGPDLRNVCGWNLDRPPHHLETSVPGVFVAGDVRSESAKRVAAAVGEGSMAVMLVHRYLAES